MDNSSSYKNEIFEHNNFLQFNIGKNVQVLDKNSSVNSGLVVFQINSSSSRQECSPVLVM